MPFVPAGRRGWRARILVLAVLSVLALSLSTISILPGDTLTTGSPKPSLGAALATVEASVYSGSFASRAGYDGIVLGGSSELRPASGSSLAVVTFYPSSRAFFAPPVAGAPALTVSEIADQYGLSPAAYASAEAYFELMGLTVVHTNPTRLSLTVGGTASEMGTAFGTRLTTGVYAGRPVTIPATPPSLPSSLESEISSVVGLSSGVDLFSMPVGLSTALSASSGGTDAASDPPDLITPAIARQIYELSPLYNVSGSSRFAIGEGVAVLLWGYGYNPTDLSTFFSSDYPTSFPLPNLQVFNLDGAPPPSSNAPSDPSKGPQELTLDLEWAGSMAPGATLDAVYVPDGPASDGYSPSVADITDAFTKAVTGIPGVAVISMSFGSPQNASQALQAAWVTDIATATQEGITLLAATGDDGGDLNPNCAGGPSVEFPAISPEVIAVGGTDPTLARNLFGQVTGLQSESAWSGSGGGYATGIPAPSWQKVGSAAAPIAAHGDLRGVPDVAAAAAYNFLYYDGQGGVAAGTSFATPLWAGLVAEMDALNGAKLGFLTPRLYTVGAGQESGRDPVGLGDVSSGSTCIGSSTAGWDAETGWGSPRALLLFEDLTATFVNLTLAATPSPVAPGGTVTLVAQLANRTSGKPIVGVPIDLSLASSTGEGPCAGVWGSEDVTTNGSGSASLTVAVPACYLGGHGTASASVTSGGYYGANSTTVSVNLLGFFPALAGIQDFPANIVAFVLIMGIAAGIGYAVGRSRRRTSPPARTTAPPSGSVGAPGPAPPPPRSPSPSPAASSPAAGPPPAGGGPAPPPGPPTG